MGRLRPRQAWGLGVLVAGTALVAVVAVSADGSPLRAPTDEGRTELPDRLLATLEVAVLIAGLLLVVALVVMALSNGRTRRPGVRGRRALLRTLLLVTALAILTGALFSRRRDDASEEGQRAAVVVTTEAPDSEGSRPTWPLAVLGAAVVVALVAAAWAGRRWSTDPDTEEDEPAPDDAGRAAAGSAFTASLADLDAEPDPRRAIVGAYTRLLDGLDAAGFGRRLSEAPEQHLRRVLEQLHVPDAPLRTLVALYAEARFSEHALTAVHKQSAIDAFRAGRDAIVGLATAGGSRP